jgi:hypothetical protein
MDLHEYNEKKQCIEWMIRHYENNCMKYLDYESVKHMKLDDLETLYNYDEAMVDMYWCELHLLEAKRLIYGTKAH